MWCAAVTLLVAAVGYGCPCLLVEVSVGEVGELGL